MALINDIANAVVAALNDAADAEEFSDNAFTAERVYVPLLDLKADDGLKVFVVPGGLSLSPATRAKTAHEYRIDVAVMKRLGGLTPALVDPLMTLTEEMLDSQRFRRFEALQVSWIRAEHDPIYVPEHLDELHQFAAVFSLFYQAWR